MNLSAAIMSKVILLTGATDGIGLETARRLAAEGHHKLLVHGRSASKLQKLQAELGPEVETYLCDLSNLRDISKFVDQIKAKHDTLDVLINNAGVFKVPERSRTTAEGLDVRFAVNTVAPYYLTKKLWDLLGGASSSRVVNVSSAAKAPVDLSALKGKSEFGDNDYAAYSQSKLAVTLWTKHLADSSYLTNDNNNNNDGPMLVSVNPASMLGSKMVREGFGVPGKDLGIGADILVRAALSEEFADASGKYYDNDSHQFAIHHPDHLNAAKCQEVVSTMDEVLETLGLN
jgi:NAD(P)-dependent dehydrogenase (short-subunit alcohol dehydrogenase family)